MNSWSPVVLCSYGIVSSWGFFQQPKVFKEIFQPKYLITKENSRFYSKNNVKNSISINFTFLFYAYLFCSLLIIWKTNIFCPFKFEFFESQKLFSNQTLRTLSCWTEIFNILILSIWHGHVDSNLDTVHKSFLHNHKLQFLTDIFFTGWQTETYRLYSFFWSLFRKLRTLLRIIWGHEVKQCKGKYGVRTKLDLSSIISFSLFPLTVTVWDSLPRTSKAHQAKCTVCK